MRGTPCQSCPRLHIVSSAPAAIPACAPTYTLLLGVQRRGVHGAAYGEPVSHGGPLFSVVLPRRRPSGEVGMFARFEAGDRRMRFARVERVGVLRGRRNRGERGSTRARVRTSWTVNATEWKQCVCVVSRRSGPWGSGRSVLRCEVSRAAGAFRTRGSS